MIPALQIVPALCVVALASPPASSAPAAPAPRGGFTVVDVVQPAVEVRGADGELLYRLTPAQARRLKRAGCTFSDRDVAVARRLSRRGFGAEALVAAYEDVVAHVEGGGSQCVESAALFRALDLPWSDLEVQCRSGQPLSRYVRRRRRGARRLANAGWWLTGIGTVLAAVGTIVIVADAVQSVPDRSDGDPSGAWLPTMFIGAPLLAAGLVGLGAGIPMGVVGRRRARRLQGDDAVLDHGTVGQLRSRAQLETLENQEQARPSLTLAPWLGSRSGGASLLLRF